uniref:G8 domain-containing protein n=1 Tax=Odontella aurita TaxID=265563 RepID=A0A7S4MFY8_9STRA|mmetsp:Transcript_20542/g.59590  ORF Transcript_20542/g.59590 Transcript_20542/m.59590 type:complete len:1152 (+) Transcript_20542:65-3520(+)
MATMMATTRLTPASRRRGGRNAVGGNPARNHAPPSTLLPLPILLLLLVVVASSLPSPVSSLEDSIVYRTYSDGFKHDDPTRSCLSGKAYNELTGAGDDDTAATATGGGDNYIRAIPNRWHSGRFDLGCKFGHRPDWTPWLESSSSSSSPSGGGGGYLSFRARVAGFPGGECAPRIWLYGGSYPRHYSRAVEISPHAVGGEGLDSKEWRDVWVPLSEFVTPEWTTLNSVIRMDALKCGDGSSGYRYEIRDVVVTDGSPPPSGGGGGGGGGGDGSATTTTTATTTSTTTTASTTTTTTTPPPPPPPTESPTAKPTDGPTPEPSPGPLPDLIVYGGTSDGHASESSDKSCLFDTVSSQGVDPDDGTEFLRASTNKWRSGGLQFGCLESDPSSNDCVHSCLLDGARPDFSPYSTLTFFVRIPNILHLDSSASEESCVPRIKIYGGGSPAKESSAINLRGSYVDAGSASSSEWRRVVVPTADLRSGGGWDLNGAKSLRFLSCSSSVANPLYEVTDVRFTDVPVEAAVSSPAPTATPPPTLPPDEATHVWYNRDWFPVVNYDAGTWLTPDQDGRWPDIPSECGGTDRECSVFIPAGYDVTYDPIQSYHIKLDNVMVEGTLRIVSSDGSQVSMTVRTIRVEEGGHLEMLTVGSSSAASSSTIDINFDGPLDTTADPTEILNGLVSLGGNVHIEGESRCSSPAERIILAPAGGNIVLTEGNGAYDCWRPGDEVELPDTQSGLDAAFYNFVPDRFDASMDSQMETFVIQNVIQKNVDGHPRSELILDRVLIFDHLAGAHAAMVTRSITLRTSPASMARGHILHTGYGSFDVKNARVEDMGRTTVEPFDNTVLAEEEGVYMAEGYGRVAVSKEGMNQAARYSLHAHHSLVPVEFSGNVIMRGLRFGIVAHNSRVNVTSNVVISVQGSGILLEDGTETGPVIRNYVSGRGDGSGNADGSTFNDSNGTDFGHGGFGLWSRSVYSRMEGNVCEGIFPSAAYGFFLHLKFMDDRAVPPVEGTPPSLIGLTRKEVQSSMNGALSLNTYGSFRSNSALGTFGGAFSSTYFFGTTRPGGHVLEDFRAMLLGSSGFGFLFGHSSTFTFEGGGGGGGGVTASYEGNTVTGVHCTNGDLVVHDDDFMYEGVAKKYGGCLNATEVAAAEESE